MTGHRAAADVHEVDNHEPSAWLRGAIADRLATFNPPHLAALLGIIAFQLNEAEAEPGTDADRICDRCGTFTPTGTPFYAGISQPSPQHLPEPWSTRLHGCYVIVGYGLCAACARREIGDLS